MYATQGKLLLGCVERKQLLPAISTLLIHRYIDIFLYTYRYIYIQIYHCIRYIYICIYLSVYKLHSLIGIFSVKAVTLQAVREAKRDTDARILETERILREARSEVSKAMDEKSKLEAALVLFYIEEKMRFLKFCFVHRQLQSLH